MARKIVLDSVHDETDSGTIANGIIEKDYTLKISQYIHERLNDLGIENAKEKIESMYILDFLVMNEDRHLNNFGVIRNVNTLKWRR